ncbi:hypothetical protein BST81_25370 [Leptolyngbya sp. 'hensonii']|uniref:AAA family ATPase n=1 Tax=Leptolyngbya sp. 'hensonii' TaxID=1922337 RepID=UPI00094F4C78|nr:AAA family ATPase [Leptolyngbya sp. 'hensonii']OLP15608.1 hypothetical protein BST81_25370 [Leptolyngbya sp. 'hensonii']
MNDKIADEKLDWLQREADNRLEAELIEVLKNPLFSSFRLGQIAKTYGVGFDLVKQEAERVAATTLGLDLDQVEFNSVVRQVEALEAISDPGLREWKIQALARKFHRTPRQLMDAYNKALAKQAPVMPLTPKELKEKYSAGVNWLIHGWIPKGSVLLLHADGGVGKSLFTYQIVESVLTGQPWQGYQVQQGGVLMVQVDEPGVILGERLDVRGIGEHPNLGILEDWQIEAMAPLEATIKRDQPELLVIDSLTAINRNSIFSENDTEYARPVLQLTNLANRTGTTVIIIHHSNASGNARGTRAIHNSVSEVWAMAVGNSPEERVLRVQKMRLGRPPGRYNFKFHEEDLSFTYLGEEGGEQEQDLTQEKKIQLWLSEGDRIGTAYAAIEVSEFLNISRGKARKLLSELWSKGLIQRKVTKTAKNQRAYLYFVPKKGDPLYTSDHLLDHPLKEDSERVLEVFKKGDPGDPHFFKQNNNWHSPGESANEKKLSGIREITDHLLGQTLTQSQKKGDPPPKKEGDPTQEADHLLGQTLTQSQKKGDPSQNHPPGVGDLVTICGGGSWIRSGSDKLPWKELRPSLKELPQIPLNQLPDALFHELTGDSLIISLSRDRKRVKVRNQQTGRNSVFAINDVQVLKQGGGDNAHG